MSTPQFDPKMTPEKQLELWVSGFSIHRGKDRSDGECCPDFSCCQPQLKWPPDMRREFVLANEEKRMEMLRHSLRMGLELMEQRKVRVI